MSLGVACLTSTSPLMAASVNNSFGFDFSADPVPSAYLDDDTEIYVSPLGPDREFANDGTWIGTGGALDFTLNNLPNGKYDITLYGHGPGAADAMYFEVNGYTSDANFNGGAIVLSDFQITGGQLSVRAVSTYAIAYMQTIGLYGPKTCTGPDSYPTITWSSHTPRYSAQDPVNRTIWYFSLSDGAEIVSTDSNGAVDFVDMSVDASSDEYLVAAPTVGQMLLLKQSNNNDPTAHLSFWDTTTHTRLNSVNLGVSVDASPGYRLGYSQGRKEAYVVGFTGNPHTAKIDVVDCNSQYSQTTTTYSFGTSVAFDRCVFAENAARLIVGNGTGSGSSPFWYFNPASPGSLTASALTIGNATGRLFYIANLGVVVLQAGGHLYVINPVNDSAVDLGSLNTHDLTAACYNDCSGLLYVAHTASGTQGVDAYDPSSSYAKSTVSSDRVDSLFFDPISNLVYGQLVNTRQVNTY